MNTWGLTAVALGFGGLLCLGLSVEGYLDKLNSMSLWRWVLSGLKYIGKHSYSIYLWHLFADNLLDIVGIFQRLGWVSGGFEAGLCTVMLSVCLGITIGQLIEKPILAWRNRILA
jgi:peptidoglycan/LPS O-acetylase OafA/YrhL